MLRESATAQGQPVNTLAVTQPMLDIELPLGKQLLDFVDAISLVDFDELPIARKSLLDAAGQVFEWTATDAGPGRKLVKGGSWDDKGCGVCRPAARHGRPEGLKHILIGFRVASDQ